MPTVVLSPVGSTGQQFFDNNGVPLAGGLLYTYTAGGTTPYASYTDYTGATPNSNPIVLDSAGRVSGGVWLESGHSYKIVLKDSTAATTFGTWDNITLLYGATSAQIAATTANTAAIATLNATKSGFRAYRSTALTADSGDIIKFNTKVYDRLSEYNTSTGFWTPTVAGTYLISAGIFLGTSQADGTQLTMIINGSFGLRVFAFYAQGAAGGYYVSGSDIFKVSAGETYSVILEGQSAASSITTGDGYTHFSAQYLGPQ